MDYLHNEGEKPDGAGDAPIAASFEKQESFAADLVADEPTDLHGAQGAPVEIPAEQPSEDVEEAETGIEGQDDNIVEFPPSDAVGAMEITTKPIVEEPSEEAKPISGTVEEVEDRSEIDADDDEEVGAAKEEPAAAGGEHAEESIHEEPQDVEMEKHEAPQSDEQMEIAEEKEPSEDKAEPATPPSSPPAEVAEVKTPRTRGRKPKAQPTPSALVKTATTPGRRGRKRKVVEEDEAQTPTPAKTPRTPGRGRVAHVKVKLSWTDYVSQEVGDRVLSCGEGEQLGHPGRTTTKKPRKVDIVEDEGLQIVQVVAGGVHSALLTKDGDVYMCGINEQGTVPAMGVEPEGSTDKFSKVELSDEIKSQGKIVMLAAGASFTAALTDKGSVIVWGNLRDTSGEINVHPLLTKMKDHPVVLIHYKKRVIVKIAAGENHLVMLEEDGKVLTFGDGKMGQLGRSKRTGSIRGQYMVDEDGRSLILILQDKKRKDIPIKDIHAGGFWTMLISDDQVFSFGLNNFEHLGVPIEGEAPADADSEDKRELRILTPGVATAYLGRHWTHMDGVQHIIARDKEGEVYGIGKNTDNALGLGTWTGNDDSEHWKYSTLERIEFPAEAGKIAGTTAKLGCSLAWTEDGDAYAWGCDTSGQLGLGLKDDDEKIVPKPKKITSAHLDGYKIISASISDNHCLFLAKKA